MLNNLKFIILPEMEWILTGFSIFLIIITFLPYWRVPYWWVRVFDFPHLQIAVLGLIIFAASAFYLHNFNFFQEIILGALVFCLLLKIYKMYPYTPFATRQTLPANDKKEDNKISIMISNVRMSNQKSEKWLKMALKADADVILAVEPNKWWEAQLSFLDNQYPYSVKYPLENTYGMILYSKLELLRSEVCFLVERDIPSIHADIKLRSGEIVKFKGVHPAPPRPYDDTAERDAELLIIGKMVAKEKHPAIVAGDLNDIAWSYTTTLFQKNSRMLDPRQGRGFFNTYNAHIPFFRYPLDYIFHTKEFRLVEMKVLEKIGSDHFPVFVELSFEPEKQEMQEPPPSPDKEEQAQTKKKIEREK